MGEKAGRDIGESVGKGGPESGDMLMREEYVSKECVFYSCEGEREKKGCKVITFSCSTNSCFASRQDVHRTTYNFICTGSLDSVAYLLTY